MRLVFSSLAHRLDKNFDLKQIGSVLNRFHILKISHILRVRDMIICFSLHHIIVYFIVFTFVLMMGPRDGTLAQAQ